MGLSSHPTMRQMRCFSMDDGDRRVGLESPGRVLLSRQSRVVAVAVAALVVLPQALQNNRGSGQLRRPGERKDTAPQTAGTVLALGRLIQ